MTEVFRWGILGPGNIAAKFATGVAALDDQETLLPPLKAGEQVRCKALEPARHDTKPPARYTDATLVKALESEGIGRPSTYATIIGTIQDRGYATRAGNQLAPTFMAFAVNDLMERHFPDLVDMQFTAQMEQALRSIDRQMASVARGALAEQAGRVESQLRRIQYAAPDPVGLAINVRSLVRDMQAGLERRCAADRARFENVAARIDSLNPMATLARGFAIVQKELSGKKPVVNSARKVKPGDRLSVSVADGAFWAEVS